MAVNVLITLSYHVVCISWTIKFLLSLMHGVTMKIIVYIFMYIYIIYIYTRANNLRTLNHNLHMLSHR